MTVERVFPERGRAAAQSGDRAPRRGVGLDARGAGEGVVGPRSAHRRRRAGGTPDAIALNPQTVEAGQDEIVLQALRTLLSRDS